MQTEQRRGLLWLIAARLAVSTFLLGAGVVFQVAAPGSLPIDPFFFLIGLTYGLSVIYLVSLRYLEGHPWLLDAQFAADAATVTAVLHFTGGMASYFPLLYALPIVGAGTLQRRSGGLRVAALSSILYAGLVYGQYTGSAGYVDGQWLADVRPFLPPARVGFYTVGANGVGFLVIGWLAGSLAERARRADARAAEASTALADLRAFSQHVIESLTSGLATTDRVGRLLTVNRAGERILGYKASEIVGRPAEAVFQLPEGFLLNARQPSGGRRDTRLDYQYRTSTGAVIDIGLSATPLVTPEADGSLLLTFQDVTAVRRLERENRRRQRLAAVGEMAAGVAHEIRNPLASMRGSIQVLRHELTLNDEQARLMDIVMRESDRLNETIRSLLTFARPQQAAAKPVDIARVLRETATLLRHSSDVREDHRIDVEVPEEGLVYETDEAQIRQVIWNLATNGLRAMPGGGRLVLAARHDADGGSTPEARDGELDARTSEAEARSAEPALILQVIDEGVGIPREQLDRLFEPFRGSFERGSGLGLAIVHRIVSDHGGEVRIASEPGKGTSVLVRLPGRPVAAEAPLAEAVRT